ncbi:P-loop containing nucleoside triphosphate hydrolase protein [Hysterangium stoloniferum]|nr:P-loop containing nucleoside triphosphate hydrolase protein [Hysterangium stoloniferum]
MNWFASVQDGYRFSPWTGSASSWITALMGNMAGSALAGNFSDASSSPLIVNNILRLFILGTVLGSVIETVRKLFRWIIDRFQPRKSHHSQICYISPISLTSLRAIAGLSVSADFQPGDITYEWLVNYLMKESVWRKPHNIFVMSKNSQRKWKFQTEKGEVDYVPNYGPVQFFRWKGYWMEISQDGFTYLPSSGEYEPIHRGGRYGVTILSLSIYTRDISVLFDFVEECRKKYTENSATDVTVYSVDCSRYYGGGGEDWSNVKVKRRRPLNSLVLDDGMLETLLDDAREFMKMESWYIAAGIPYRRGYLLYGPPGTGKTSTVYTLVSICSFKIFVLNGDFLKAGELGLEIYSLSLAEKNMDDGYLARLVTKLPPKAILLIEDIDCAFPTREEIKEQEKDPYNRNKRTSEVTFSGLLNVLDGVGSEEGKIFFATASFFRKTTNHIDRLDPALIRPGRIDRQMQYKLTSRKQFHALFLRFYHAIDVFNKATGAKANEKVDINKLAETFSEAIPEFEFSIAEIQGFLLGWKLDPIGAVDSIHTWLEKESDARREQEERKAALVAQREMVEAQNRMKEFQPVIAGIENAMGPKRRKRRSRRHRKSSSDSDGDSSELDSGTEYSRSRPGSKEDENHERRKKQRRKKKKNDKKLENQGKEESSSSRQDTNGVRMVSTTDGMVSESTHAIG